jgi:hypothetical protein
MPYVASIGTHRAVFGCAPKPGDRFTNRPVWIRGIGIGRDSVMHQHKPDTTTRSATMHTAKQGFTMVTILEGSANGAG